MTEEKENNTNIYININKVAEAKGLKSNRSLRLEINKPESKYVAREVKVNGGTSYEILYSSLEPEIQLYYVCVSKKALKYCFSQIKEFYILIKVKMYHLLTIQILST